MSKSEGNDRRQVENVWSLSLEEWLGVGALGRVADSRFPKFQTAPFEAHKPERFHHVPLVAFVSTRAGREFQKAMIEAAELIRLSTNGFRSMLFVDEAEIPSSEVAAWHVEQCVPEDFWLANTGDNWLPVVANYFQEVKEQFAVSYVVAPRNITEAKSTIAKLGALFGARPGVTRRGLERFDGVIVADSRKSGFRGGWGGIQQESSSISFESSAGELVSGSFSEGIASASLVGFSGPSDGVYSSAQSAGWRTARLHAVTKQQKDAEISFQTAVLRASAGASKKNDMVIEVVQDASCESKLGSLSQGKLVAPPNVDEWTLDINGTNMPITFSPSDSSTVLSKVRSAYAKFLW